MSTDVVKKPITETSPQVYARIGGVLYLIIIVIGFCSEFFVRDNPILVLALIGELSLCLWLMVKGVNVPKWNEKHAWRLADLLHDVLDLIVIPWPYVLATFVKEPGDRWR